MARTRVAEYVAAGLVMAGVAAFGIHEITAPRVVASTSTPTASTPYCAAQYRELGRAIAAAMADLNDPGLGVRVDHLSRQYRQGGCQ